jgi:hypothetical protein
VGRKILVGAIILIMVVLAMATLHVYYVRDVGGGTLLWNGTNAYVFIGIADYGYRFTYLTLMREWVFEIFPFGASPPTHKHSRALVLAITPTGVTRYSFDNFWISSPPYPYGQNIYAGNLLSTIPGPTKWAGTHFEPISPQEQQEIHKAQQAGTIPASPSYDNVGGWSRRMIGGQVEQKSPHEYVENDGKVTIELGGEPLTLVMNSGFVSRHAYIDLLRPGHASERVWDLNENSRRVDDATYRQIFENASASVR